MKKIVIASMIVTLAVILVVPTACIRLAEFEVAALNISPSEVVIGEPTTVTADVENVGGIVGTYIATLTIDGVEVETKEVTLTAGAKETVVFTLSKDTPGTYYVELGGLSGTLSVRALKPAEFKVVDLSVPEEVFTGEPVTVTADVTNTGEVEGNFTTGLVVNGTEVATETVTVAPGVTESISFTLTKESPGSYTLRIAGLTGTLNVLKPLAQETADSVIASLNNTRTAQFDMDMTMDMAGELVGVPFDMIMVMDCSGAWDLENRKTSMDMTMLMTTPGEPEVEMGMEMYLIGDMMYMSMEMPEMDPMWMRMEVPEESWEETWEEMSMVEPLLELVEAAEVEVIGTERVGGIDCYVLQLTPDLEQLWQTTMQQAEITGEIPHVAVEFIQEMFRSYSVKQWVAKDTYFVTKEEIDMAMEFTPEAMGLPEEEGVITMDMAIFILTYNHNQPVSIELPPEAEEAIEVPME